MFVSKRKKREKAAKKLKLFLDALELWDKFQSVHCKIYSVKTSLTPLFNTNEEIRIHTERNILGVTYHKHFICSLLVTQWEQKSWKNRLLTSK